MFLLRAHFGVVSPGLPRASGGVSAVNVTLVFEVLSSPRKRGCFLHILSIIQQKQVFPAQAGVFLDDRPPAANPLRLPRASGGVSATNPLIASISWSSPRKRGCFLECLSTRHAARVFPAQAGVFLAFDSSIQSASGLPRASGGVSQGVKDFNAAQQVFPAQAGVFPSGSCRSASYPGLPRASGGVSNLFG